MFGKKKFGLNEAKRLAKEKEDVSVPTVLATLRILDVPNVFGQEMKKVISKLTGSVKTLRGEIMTTETRDQTDEKETKEQLKEVEEMRRLRERRNKTTARILENNILKIEKEIESIKSLEKYA